jgi:hypothetical protein
MSQRSGSASRARSIGLANASPTMEMLFTFSALDGVEQFDDVEVPAGHRHDAAGDASRMFKR